MFIVTADSAVLSVCFEYSEGSKFDSVRTNTSSNDHMLIEIRMPFPFLEAYSLIKGIPQFFEQSDRVRHFGLNLVSEITLKASFF